MLPTDIDRPDLGSIAIQISRPLGVANTTVNLSSTKTVSVDVSQQLADQADQQAYNQQVGAGPSQGFVGPLQPVIVTRSVTTNHPIAGTSGTYGDQLSLANFLSYEYREHYLTPCDSWSCSISVDALKQSDRDKIQVGARVDVSIDGQPQTTGYLDTIDVDVAAGNGTVMHLEGRSWIASIVDAHVDPQLRFTPSMTLQDVASQLLAPYGVTVLATSSLANRNAISGAIHGIKTSKKGKALKSFVLHQEKPYPQEGAWAFLVRICNRFGLWPRPAADGKTVILTSPDFDQDPIYQLHHKTDNTRSMNNVKASRVRRSREEQPSVIFASGVGGGGEFAKATLRGAILNPAVSPPDGSLQTVLGAYPSVRATLPDLPAIQGALLDKPYLDPNARPLFLYDSESHTQEQLDAFLKRELSLRMRKALDAHYTIVGHRIGGQPVAVDTTIDVQDDRSDLHTTLWVIGRRFSKSPRSGTTTELELVRLGTIVA